MLSTGNDVVGSEAQWHSDSNGNAYVMYNTAGWVKRSRPYTTPILLWPIPTSELQQHVLGARRWPAQGCPPQGALQRSMPSRCSSGALVDPLLCMLTCMLTFNQSSFYSAERSVGWVVWAYIRSPAGTLYPAKQCLVELTPSWLNVTGRKTCWVPPDGFGLEGGAFWDRNGTYVMQTSCEPRATVL